MAFFIGAYDYVWRDLKTKEQINVYQYAVANGFYALMAILGLETFVFTQNITGNYNR